MYTYDLRVFFPLVFFTYSEKVMGNGDDITCNII